MEYRIRKNSRVHEENWKVQWCCRFSTGSMKLIAGDQERRTDLFCSLESPSRCHYLYSSADSRPTQQQEREHWWKRWYKGEKTPDCRMLRSPQRLFGPFSLPRAFLWPWSKAPRLPLLPWFTLIHFNFPAFRSASFSPLPSCEHLRLFLTFDPSRIISPLLKAASSQVWPYGLVLPGAYLLILSHALNRFFYSTINMKGIFPIELYDPFQTDIIQERNMIQDHKIMGWIFAQKLHE